MKLEEFEEILKLCKEIGIETLADLAMFKRQQVANNETLLQGLKRYANELKGE